MIIYRKRKRRYPTYLTNDLKFPSPQEANSDGLLAVGGDLSSERLILAYNSGIFPWYDYRPIKWYSPNPRMVLLPENLRINRSLRKALKKRPYEIRFDTAFRDVMKACAEIERPDQDGTWITEEMLQAYTQLHEQGIAHSAEAWHEGELVGGVYGLSLGGSFFGESMFTRANDASKIAFTVLTRQLIRWSISLIDCQVYTEHLASLGAELWPRSQFLKKLEQTKQIPTKRGSWTIDEDLAHPPFGS